MRVGGRNEGKSEGAAARERGESWRGYIQRLRLEKAASLISQEEEKLRISVCLTVTEGKHEVAIHLPVKPL